MCSRTEECVERSDATAVSISSHCRTHSRAYCDGRGCDSHDAALSRWRPLRVLLVRPLTGRRMANPRAALGFLQLPPHEPELQMLHRWLDMWEGVGLITVGVERQGLRVAAEPRAESEWGCALGSGDATRVGPRREDDGGGLKDDAR